MIEPLIPAERAAEQLLVTVGTLAKWRVTGAGPAFIRVNRRIAYHPRDIETWLDARRVTSTSEVAQATARNG